MEGSWEASIPGCQSDTDIALRDFFLGVNQTDIALRDVSSKTPSGIDSPARERSPAFDFQLSLDFVIDHFHGDLLRALRPSTLHHAEHRARDDVRLLLDHLFRKFAKSCTDLARTSNQRYALPPRPLGASGNFYHTLAGRICAAGFIFMSHSKEDFAQAWTALIADRAYFLNPR